MNKIVVPQSTYRALFPRAVVAIHCLSRQHLEFSLSHPVNFSLGHGSVIQAVSGSGRSIASRTVSNRPAAGRQTCRRPARLIQER